MPEWERRGIRPTSVLEEFAVIDLTWQACHTYNIEAFQVAEIVKSLSMPYLHLETDYSSTDMESLELRIEALLEMI